jgi:hypothetical protein
VNEQCDGIESLELREKIMQGKMMPATPTATGNGALQYAIEMAGDSPGDKPATPALLAAPQVVSFLGRRF